MRIRSTKPEFWRSKTIADALDWSDRYVLKGLEAYVDDNGVGKDDIELIATEVFPRDTYRSPQECVVRLQEAISRIHSAGLIARYEVNGEKLLYIDKWRDIQRINRPSNGRFPRPDGTMEYDEPVNRESYMSPQECVVSTHRTFSAGTGEQGNRGTGEVSSVTSVEGGPGGDPQNSPARSRGTRLPDGWRPGRDVVAQMRSDHPQIDLQAEHAKFIDYWRARAGKDARKADWDATWRNWIRRAAEQQPRTNGNGAGKATQKALGYRQLGAELIEELHGRSSP